MMRFIDFLRRRGERGDACACRRQGAANALAALAIILGLVTLPASPQAQPATERTVNVYNWTDYIDPSVLDDFTRETGIKVVYDMYDNNEIVATKLLAGKSGYDVVVPSGPVLSRLIRAGLFLTLERSKLPNARHIWPDIAARLASHDPGNQFAVNYMWGTTGIGLNLAKVRERLGLKPDVSARLKDCGIHVLDAPEDILPGVLRYLGLNPDSKNEANLRKAADALTRVRGNIRTFHSSEYLNALASGEICMAVGYSGDILQARRRAEEARNGIDIQFIVPREGAQMWFDSMAIPADAANPVEAHAFIDFMLRPDVAARNSNFVSYASGNLPARELIRPEIKGNPGIYPDQATFARLFTTTAYDERLQRAVGRLWTRLKTGR
jgi:putrescine transport system substrate-binding protein